MRLTKYLIKGRRNIIITEFAIIFLFFMFSSIICLPYLRENNELWLSLLASQEEPDLEIFMSQSFQSYLESVTELSERIMGFYHFSIINLPSILMEMQIGNESIVDFNLYVINIELLERMNISLSESEVLFSSFHLDNVSVSDINTNFTLETVYNNLTVVNSISQQVLYSLFFGSKDPYPNMVFKNTSIIISDPFFSKFLSSVNSSALQNLTEGYNVNSWYVFSWSKKQLSNLPPRFVEEIHQEWLNVRISAFFQTYYQQYVSFKDTTITMDMNFLVSLNALINTMNLDLLKIYIVTMFVTVVVVFSLIQLNKSAIYNNKKVLNLLISRGLKKRSIKIRLAFLELSITFLSQLIALGLISSVLSILHLIKWIYAINLIFITASIILTLIFYFQAFLLKTSFDQIFLEEVKSEKIISKSRKFSNLIILSMIVVGIITLTFIILLNQKYLHLLSVSSTVLLTISVSCMGIISLVILVPFILQKIFLYLFKQTINLFSSISVFITKLFEKLNRNKKQLWLLIFSLQLVFSLMLSGTKTYYNNQEQIQKSSICYDISIKIEPSSLDDVKMLSNSSASIASYIEPIFGTSSILDAIYIYLATPRAFYDGINLYGNYFKKHSNFEVFSLLNESSEYCVINKQEADRQNIKINDIIHLYKTASNGSKIVESKKLLDVANYIPFYSFLFPEEYTRIYLMKYNNITHISNLDNYVVYSFATSNNFKFEAFLSQLQEFNILFEILHTQSYNSLIPDETDTFSLEIKTPLFFLLFIISIIILSLFVDIKKEGNYLFSFYNERGLYYRKSRLYLNYWFISQYVFVSIISYFYSILILLTTILILNQFVILPINIIYSWEQVILSILVITFTILFALFIEINKTRKGIFRNKIEGKTSE